MNEQIIGFQLRVPASTLNAWSEARKSQYLLNKTVSRPLSVDDDVWPLLDDAQARADLFIDFELPSNGINVHALRERALNEGKIGQLIAITASPDDSARLRSQHRIETPIQPLELLATQRLRRIGFDVADAWLTSGVSNCDAGAAKEALSRQFGDAVNEYGLFRARESAVRFKDVIGNAIPDHAPFFVMAIWANLA